jgi:hypothetical protein
MRVRALALLLPLVASCSLVAGLGDFEPADEGSGAAGAGSPASSGGAQGGSGGASQGGATSQGGGGTGPVGGGAQAGGAGGTGGAAPCVSPPCDVGQACTLPADCKSGKCDDNVCTCNDHLVISEVRTRSASSGSDDFIELYNPTGADVVLTANDWTLEYRNSGSMTYSDRWKSSGETIPAYGHLLIANIDFSGPVPDVAYDAGIGDDASIRLRHMAGVVDAICYCSTDNPCLPFTGSPPFSCEGTPVFNPNGPDTDGDISMERKGGGAAGSCIDTDQSSDDFKTLEPADPQNSTSAPVP